MSTHINPIDLKMFPIVQAKFYFDKQQNYVDIQG